MARQPELVEPEGIKFNFHEYGDEQFPDASSLPVGYEDIADKVYETDTQVIATDLGGLAIGYYSLSRPNNYNIAGLSVKVDSIAAYPDPKRLSAALVSHSVEVARENRDISRIQMQINGADNNLAYAVQKNAFMYGGSAPRNNDLVYVKPV